MHMRMHAASHNVMWNVHAMDTVPDVFVQLSTSATAAKQCWTPMHMLAKGLGQG